MKHKTKKQTIGAHQQYKQHQSTKSEKKSCFHGGQLVYFSCSPLSTSAAEKMALKANPKLFPCALVPYCAIATTSDIFTFDQGGIPKMLFTDAVSLLPCRMQPQDNIFDA